MKVDKSKWGRKTLKDIGTIVSGATPRTDDPLNWGDKYNWVTPAELKGEKYIGRTQKQITDHALSKTKLTLMPPGTVLLSSRAPIGKVAITTEPMYCNQGFKNIVCGNKFFNGFLYYYLIANQKELNRRGNGVTFKEISKKNVEAFPVIVPSLYEQQAIATELDTVQEMIDGYKAQIADLDTLAQSIFMEMFGDPLDNPKGWKKDLLENIVHSKCAISYGIVQPGEDEENGIPVIRPVDLTSTYVSLNGLKKVSPSISNNYRRTILRGDEILLCVRGTTGIVSLATEELKGCNVTRGIVPLYFDSQNRWFIYYCFKSSGINNEIQKHTKGATLKQINIGELRRISFPIPPLHRQQQFAKQVEAIEKQKDLLREQLKDAETLMAERMQYYFS